MRVNITSPPKVTEWLVDGKPLDTTDGHFKVEFDQTHISLTIDKATVKDTAEYTLIADGITTATKLEIQGDKCATISLIKIN